MAEWKNVTLLGAMPQVIDTVISSVDSVSEALLTSVQITKAGFELSKMLMNGIPDPVLLAIESLSTAILKEISEMKGIALQQLVIHPYQDGMGSYQQESEVMTLSFPDLLQKVSDFFENQEGTQNPIFTESDECGAIGLLLAAPSLEVFSDLLTSFANIFADDELKILKEKIQRTVEKQNFSVTVPLPDPPVLPDFDNVNLLNLFPPLEEMLNEVEGFVQGIVEMSSPSSSIIDDVIQLIEGKVQQIEEMKELVSKAQNILTMAVSNPQIHGLYIPPQAGGINRIQSEIKKASSAFDPNSPFCAGIVFIGGKLEISFFAELLGVSN